MAHGALVSVVERVRIFLIFLGVLQFPEFDTTKILHVQIHTPYHVTSLLINSFHFHVIYE